MNSHTTLGDVLMMFGIVDENRDTFRTNLLSPITKHKQHCINDVGLAAPVRTDDGGKALDTRDRISTQ